MVRRTRSPRSLIVAGMLVCLIAAATTTAAFAQQSGRTATPTGTVYVLFPNVTWVWTGTYKTKIKQAFKKYAPGITLNIVNAQGSVATQQAQMETAIANKAKAVVLVPQQSDQTGGMLASAADAGMPVITYVNDPGPGPTAYYVGYLYKQMGELQPKYLVKHLPKSPRPYRIAMILGDPKWEVYKAQQRGFYKYFDPLIKNGTVKVVCKYDTINWLPPTAGKNMEQCLTKTGGGVDGIFGNNDDTLLAAWAAVVGRGLQDKVKVLNGLDANIPALQRILLGQGITEEAPGYDKLSASVAQLTVAAINKTRPPQGLINTITNNKYTGSAPGRVPDTKRGVPTTLVPGVLITAQNIDKTVVKGGLWTKAQLCKGITKKVKYCSG